MVKNELSPYTIIILCLTLGLIVTLGIIDYAAYRITGLPILTVW